MDRKTTVSQCARTMSLPLGKGSSSQTTLSGHRLNVSRRSDWAGPMRVCMLECRTGHAYISADAGLPFPRGDSTPTYDGWKPISPCSEEGPVRTILNDYSHSAGWNLVGCGLTAVPNLNPNSGSESLLFAPNQSTPHEILVIPVEPRLWEAQRNGPRRVQKYPRAFLARLQDRKACRLH